MSENIVAVAAKAHGITERDLGNLLLTGDVTDLSPESRADLLVALAHHVGLDPLERPFELIKDGKRTVVYARAACADGLCRERGITTELIEVGEREVSGTRQIIAKVTAKTLDLALLGKLVALGVTPDAALGASTRSKTAVGALPVMQQDTEWRTSDSGKKYKATLGEREPTPAEVSNMLMKASTKADRRAVLKLVGLGGVVTDAEFDTMDPTGERFSVVQDEPEAAPADAKWSAICRAFDRFKVKPQELLTLIEVGDASEVTEAHHDELRAVFQKINSGEATVDEVFGPEQPAQE